MRPDLRHIKDVPAVLLGLLWLHDLEVHGPGRIVARLYRIVHVGSMIVGILSGDFFSLLLGKVFDALLGLKMDFDIDKPGLCVY